MTEAKPAERCRCSHLRLFHTKNVGRCCASRVCTCLYFRELEAAK